MVDKVSEELTPAIPELEMEPNEIPSHYELRKAFYIKCTQEGGVSKEKAQTLSLCYRNMVYLGCEYPQDVLDDIAKYKPDDE